MPNADKSPVNDPTLLLKRISDTFPGLQWDSYEYIDEGWDHEILILDRKYVFRFPNDAEYLEQLKTEIKILKRLKPFIAIGMPHYTFIAPDYSFAGYVLVPGSMLTAEAFHSLESAEQTTIAKQLAGFLSTMHTVIAKGRDFSAIEPSDMKEAQALIKAQSEQYLQTVLNEEEFKTTQKIIAEVDQLLTQPLPRALIHGDVYYNHLLWDEPNKQLGIIDFSDMNQGDPAFDFAELYEYGEDFVNQVYSYYSGPKDTTFLARAQTYLRWVGVFMMIDHFVYHKTSFQVARETFDRLNIK